MYFNSFLQHLQTHKTFSGSIALIHPKKVNLYNDSIHIAVILTSRIVLSWGIYKHTTLKHLQKYKGLLADIFHAMIAKNVKIPGRSLYNDVILSQSYQKVLAIKS